MANDISLAVGDGARRMSYARAGGCQGDIRSVRLTEARNRRQSAAAGMSPDNSGDVRISGLSPLTSPLISGADIPLTIRTLESAVEVLRGQLAKANQWAEAERGRADRAEQRVVDKDVVIDHLRGRLDALMTLLANRRPW
jgi:hypothetical protein